MSLADDPIAALTPREREVLAHIAAGKTNVEIAGELNIRFDTAKWHVSEVLSKLGVDRREDAAKEWRRWQRVDRRFLRALSPVRFGRAAKVGLGAAALLVVGAVVFAIVAQRDSGTDLGLEGVFVATMPINVAEGENRQLTIINARTGETVTELISDEFSYLVPRFSPEAARIAVIASGPPDSDSYLVSYELPSGREHRIAEALQIADLGSPVWSPDGTHLAMGQWRLSVFDADMELVARVPDGEPASSGGGTLLDSLWSPDSQYVAQLGNENAVLIAGRDGSGWSFPPETVLSGAPGGFEYDSRTDRIVFAAWTDERTFRITYRRMDFSDGNREYFRASLRVADQPSWTFEPGVPEDEAVGEVEREFAGMEQKARDAARLVPGADEESVNRYPGWYAHDGQTWVQIVPYPSDANANGADAARLVILLPEPVVFDLPTLPPPTRTGRAIDVVIVE